MLESFCFNCLLQSTVSFTVHNVLRHPFIDEERKLCNVVYCILRDTDRSKRACQPDIVDIACSKPFNPRSWSMERNCTQKSCSSFNREGIEGKGCQ